MAKVFSTLETSLFNVRNKCCQLLEMCIIQYWEQILYDIGKGCYQASTTSFHTSVSIGFVVLECYRQIIMGGRWVVEIVNTTPSTTRLNTLCLNILYRIDGRVVDFLQRRVRMRVKETHHSTLPIEVIVKIDDDGLIGRRGRHGKLFLIDIIIGFTIG